MAVTNDQTVGNLWDQNIRLKLNKPCLAVNDRTEIDYHWHNIPSKAVTDFVRCRPYIKG